MHDSGECSSVFYIRLSPLPSGHTNALSESWFATLKRELLHDRRWWHPRQARRDVLRWISYYNQRRRHSALGMLSPIDYEYRSTTLALAA